MRRPRPGGLVLLTAFFVFGALMSLLTALALLDPGGSLQALWRLRPEALVSLLRLGGWAVALMLAVGAGCTLAAIGLWGQNLWGYRLAFALLGINLLGDATNAVLRRDWRTLIGLPIGGLLLWYLHRLHARGHFAGAPTTRSV